MGNAITLDGDEQPSRSLVGGAKVDEVKQVLYLQAHRECENTLGPSETVTLKMTCPVVTV